MNIQPAASPLTKLEERPVQAAEHTAAPAAAVGKPAESRDAGQASREDLAAALKKINAAMAISAQTLEFSIDDDSKDIVVKVIDQSTKEVVRQIPSKEALEIAKSLDKMQGLLIRQTA
jgi:flagellar protein FlaG